MVEVSPHCVPLDCALVMRFRVSYVKLWFRVVLRLFTISHCPLNPTLQKTKGGAPGRF